MTGSLSQPVQSWYQCLKDCDIKQNTLSLLGAYCLRRRGVRSIEECAARTGTEFGDDAVRLYTQA